MARYRKIQQNFLTFYLVHTTIANYISMTRILAHTLGGNFELFCEVNQKFKHFFVVFLDTTPYNKAVLEPRVSPAFAITYFYNHCNISPIPMEIYMKECGNSDYFAKFNQKVNDPKMTFDPTSVEVTFVTLPKDHFYQSPTKICQSMWIQ